MIFSTTLDILALDFGREKGIEIIANAGFPAIDLSMFRDLDFVFADNWKETAKKYKDLAASFGVHFNQAHAPFGGGFEKYTKETALQLPRVIEFAAMVGAKQIIVHPAQKIPYLGREEEMFEINMDFYSKLAPYAKNCGIKIAIENMWGVLRDCPDKICANVCSTAEELAAYADALGDPFVVCLDVGHAGLVNETADRMIPILGKRLHSLHIHDNDFYDDHHTAPFHGKINWDALTTALADIGYDESFTYEVAGSFNARLPKELLLPAGKYLHAIGSYLVSEIERKKK